MGAPSRAVAAGGGACRNPEIQHYFSDGERVVVLNHVGLDAGEADTADVLTYRDGKVAKFQVVLDTALFERAHGTK